MNIISPSIPTQRSLDWKQLPLDFGFPSANRVASILALSDTEATRVQKLLLRWSKNYGSANIHVNNEVIIVGESTIGLTDTTRDDAYKTPTSGKLLFNSPNDDLAPTKAWIDLYDAIP